MSLSLVKLMQTQSLLDTTEIGPAVFVMRSAQRSAFDATELIAICERDFSDVTPDLIEGYRRDWRRTTMEALQAKLRVRELYEAQSQARAARSSTTTASFAKPSPSSPPCHSRNACPPFAAPWQVSTFGHQQARSLLLALRLDGASRRRRVGQDELLGALGRMLPQQECDVLMAFLRGSADKFARGHDEQCSRTADEPCSPRADSEEPAASSSADGPAGGGSDSADVDDRASLSGAQLVVCVAVVCDGPVEQKLRLCFEAFDGGSKGALTRAELTELLSAVYRTYYREPPAEREVRTFAEVVFMDDNGTLRADVPMPIFLSIGAAQPTLVQCFCAHRKHVLRTPRSVSQRHLAEQPAGSMLETLINPLVPTCLVRRSSPVSGGQDSNSTRARLSDGLKSDSCRSHPPGSVQGQPRLAPPPTPGDVRPSAASLRSGALLRESSPVLPEAIGAAFSGLGSFGKATAAALSDALGGAVCAVSGRPRGHSSYGWNYTPHACGPPPPPLLPARWRSLGDARAAEAQSARRRVA